MMHAKPDLRVFLKIFGIIGVVLGVLIGLLGIANVDFIGGMGMMRCLGLGFVCCAVGAICIAIKSITSKLNDMQSNITRISKLVSSSGNQTAEHIVDQLRQEGIIIPGADVATDHEIDTFLN